MLIKTLFWVSVGSLFYVYIGYFLCLKIISLFRNITLRSDESYEPFVSVIIASFNEGNNIEERIINLLKLDYPKSKLEIIIGSDGSMDDTVEVAQRFAGEGIEVFDFKENRGRALVHNDCVKRAKGEIIVFTDAETIFERNFLRKVIRNYADERVGSVVGNLSYISRGNEYENAEGFYFKYEVALRTLESRIGILFSGTGACFSVRKKLYIELKNVEDVDHASPIHCIKQGSIAYIEPEAKAYDYPHGNVKGIFKARIRLTSKALSAILRVCGFAFWFRHPIVGWGIVSHRFMKWFGGFFLAGALASNIYLAGMGMIYSLAFVVQTAFYGLFLVGAASNYFNRKFKIADWVFIFIIANAGMSIGVLRAFIGHVPSSYAKDE